MSKGSPANVVPRKTISPDLNDVKQLAIERVCRALNYLVIYAYILVVYGGAAGADYLLFLILWSLLSEEIRKYPLVSEAFDYARIGLALLFIGTAVVHGIISTISQIKLDIKLAQDE